ncbi:MAG: glycogen debranching N-terminal domain-containing protein, partial [Chloroflexia bacterium]
MSITDIVTLKDDFTLLLSGTDGDVAGGLEGHGIYLSDTRYLSFFELEVNGVKPDLLSHTLDYNIAATFRYGVPYTKQAEGGENEGLEITHAPNAIGVTRQRYIKHGLVESIELNNFYPEPVKISVTLKVGVDFADIFEVRGMRRDAPGHAVYVDMKGNDGSVVFRSRPIDQPQGASAADSKRVSTQRSTSFTSNIAPSKCVQGEMQSLVTGLTVPVVTLQYELELMPHKPVTLQVKIMPEPQSVGEASEKSREGFRAQVAEAKGVFTRWEEECTRVRTGNYELDRIFKTGTLDLRSLMQHWPQGLVVTAGI